MTRRPFGSLGEVSALTLGGAGLMGGWGHEPDLDEAVATTRAAVDAGVDHIDVAPGYGDGGADRRGADLHQGAAGPAAAGRRARLVGRAAMTMKKELSSADFHGIHRRVIERAALQTVRHALSRTPVVAVVGPRQCGKTTLARQIVPADSPGYFDLEDPLDLARLDQPMTALQSVAGVAVIDEVQRRRDLFPVLRVLVDGDDGRRFLILGSAGPDLLRQASESLAGRIEYIELTGFQPVEIDAGGLSDLWCRGGFPRSFLAANDADSAAWRRAFLRSFVERDLPQFGAELPSPTVHRLLAMLAHYHGQIVNVAELANALQIGQGTVRRYLDLLEQLFLIRQLRPWHENLRKRQVKRPKLYFRDAGLYHHLLGIATMDELHRHPKIGASWEGFIIEKIAFEAEPDQLHFWATHNGAELDLLMIVRGRRIGVEIKRVDAPRRTTSMTIACRDLSLDALDVVYPGPKRYAISDRITAVPADEPFRAA